MKISTIEYMTEECESAVKEYHKRLAVFREELQKVESGPLTSSGCLETLKFMAVNSPVNILKSYRKTFHDEAATWKVKAIINPPLDDVRIPIPRELMN